MKKYSNNQKVNNINKPPTHDNNSNNGQMDNFHTEPTSSVQTPYSYTKVRPTEKAQTSSPKSRNLPKTEEPTEVYNDQPKSDCFKTEPLHTSARQTEYSTNNSESLKVGNPHNTDELNKKHPTDSESIQVGNPHNTYQLTEKQLQQIHLQEPEDPTDTQTQKSSSSLDNPPSTDISTGSRLPNNEGKRENYSPVHFLCGISDKTFISFKHTKQKSRMSTSQLIVK